jgi:flavin-dependent dehydrogenase
MKSVKHHVKGFTEDFEEKRNQRISFKKFIRELEEEDLFDEDETFSIGDEVCFKDDVEKCGEVVAIDDSNYGQFLTISYEEDGNRYKTKKFASECWSN